MEILNFHRRATSQRANNIPRVPGHISRNSYDSRSGKPQERLALLQKVADDASEQVRVYLHKQVADMTTQLSTLKPSEAGRWQRENRRLQELLTAEAAAREEAETARLQGSDLLHETSSKLHNSLEQQYSNSEANRKSLLAKQNLDAQTIGDLTRRIGDLERERKIVKDNLVDVSRGKFRLCSTFLPWPQTQQALEKVQSERVNTLNNNRVLQDRVYPSSKASGNDTREVVIELKR